MISVVLKKKEEYGSDLWLSQSSHGVLTIKKLSVIFNYEKYVLIVDISTLQESSSEILAYLSNENHYFFLLSLTLAMP